MPRIEEQRQSAAVDELDRVAFNLDRTTRMKDPQAAGVPELVRHHRIPRQALGIGDGLGAGLAGNKTHSPEESAGPIRVVTEDHDLVRPAGKGHAVVGHAILGERRRVDAGRDIQLAAVGRVFVAVCAAAGSARVGLGGIPEFHEQVAEISVTSEPVLAAIVGSVPVVVAGPEGILIELDPLALRAAEEHRAHAAIADGQGLARPVVGRLIVPQRQMLVLPCTGLLRGHLLAGGLSCQAAETGDRQGSNHGKKTGNGFHGLPSGSDTSGFLCGCFLFTIARLAWMRNSSARVSSGSTLAG